MTSITIKVAKAFPYDQLSKAPEGIFATDDKLVINWHSDIFGFGGAHTLVELGQDCFYALAKAMMNTNADEAIKAFGRAMQAGIPKA